jgi:hypothetical protein
VEHDELRDYAEREADYFREHGVRIAVTGWTLTALLSSRLARIPRHRTAGSFLPPVFERCLFPAPCVPWGCRSSAGYRRRSVDECSTQERPVSRSHTGGFNRRRRAGVEGVPTVALLLGDLTPSPTCGDVGVSRADLVGQHHLTGDPAAGAGALPLVAGAGAYAE